jgi:hypothetical protein
MQKLIRQAKRACPKMVLQKVCLTSKEYTKLNFKENSSNNLLHLVTLIIQNI